jgi:hypothetical protein
LASANSLDGGLHTVTLSQRISFVGLIGPAHDPAAKASSSYGYGMITSTHAVDFLNAPGPSTISFTGVHFTVNVLSFSDGMVDRPYSGISLGVTGDSATAVPEPASAALCLLGLVVVGALHHRHRQGVLRGDT